MEILKLGPEFILLLAFIFAGTCGLAAWFRSEDESWRGAGSSILNGGCIGLATSAIGFRYFKDKFDVGILLGICCLLGLGGPGMADFVTGYVKDFVTLLKDYIIDFFVRNFGKTPAPETKSKVRKRKKRK